MVNVIAELVTLSLLVSTSIDSEEIDAVRIGREDGQSETWAPC
jgi:hypothetical protein